MAQKISVSDDVLKRNPHLAEELLAGDWVTEPEARKKKKEDSEDSKYLFTDALSEFAPHVPQPVGHGGGKFEFRPIPGRAFRCDWAWPEWKIIVEVDGGNLGVRKIKKGRLAGHYVPTGRHTKDSDYWKINEIVALGYTVFRFTKKQLKKKESARTCVLQVIRLMRAMGFVL